MIDLTIESLLLKLVVIEAVNIRVKYKLLTFLLGMRFALNIFHFRLFFLNQSYT